MNLKSLLLTALVSVSSFGIAQSNLLNATHPDQIGVKTEEQKALDNDHPLEYGYVGDRDILFSRMIWEKIVLDERVNFPLYYPIDTNNIGSDRRSLFDVLWKNVSDGTIANVYDDSYFTGKKSMKDLGQQMVDIDTLDVGFDQLNQDGYIDPEYIIKTEIQSANVTAYHIKGTWYFDKRQGELKYRLIGLAPAAADVNFINSDDQENKNPIPLFWVFYPDVRDILHEAKTYNTKNSAMPFSFDHVLNSRRFSGIAFKEENVYGDRQIDEYIPENSLMQLLESERIKEKIRNFELDMWQF
ncbi:gliding motility protein GldN [Aurantibacter sp.]|uniref:type IX secretion system ring protein PorN/GldN n=1 Tax=Aurantibacter sp. TaxID=2807103 RepID=UPI0035C7CA21